MEIDPRFLFITTGFNLRPTELNAAFGLHQLPKLSTFNRRRNEIGQAWHEAFVALVEAEGRLRFGTAIRSRPARGKRASTAGARRCDSSHERLSGGGAR